MKLIPHITTELNPGTPEHQRVVIEKYLSEKGVALDEVRKDRNGNAVTNPIWFEVCDV